MLIEIIHIQNFSNLSILLSKSRRVKALVKLLSLPTFLTNLFSYTYFKVNSYVVNSAVKPFYLINYLFNFYKKLIIRDKGLITNNITKSYNYTVIFFTQKYLNNKNIKLTSKSNKCFSNYILPIKVINFSLKNHKLKKLYIYILLFLLSYNLTYLNCLNIFCSYLYKPYNLNFFIFYNNYYLKIYNY